MMKLFQQSNIRLRKNMLSGSVYAGGSIAVSVLAYPVYLHFLGAELYGLWALLSIMIFFCTISNFGMDEALIKYIAEEYGKKGFKTIKEIFSTGMHILLVSGCLIFFASLLVNSSIPQLLQLDQVYAMMFRAIFPFIVLLSIYLMLVVFVNSVLKGLGRFDQASYILLIGRIASLGISVLFLLSGLKLWALYWGQFLSFGIVMVLSAVYVYLKIGNIFVPGLFKIDHVKRMLRFGGVLTASRLMVVFLEPFVKFIIVRYVGLSEVTYFEIANKIVYQIRSLFERGISAIMPEVSRLSVFSSRSLNDLMKKVSTWNYILGGIVFGVLFLCAKPILHLWLGNEYHIAIKYGLQVISIGYVVNLFSIPAYYYFMGTARVGYCLLNHGIQSIMNFVILIILVLLHMISYSYVVIVYAFSVASAAIVLLLIYYIRSVDMGSTNMHQHIDDYKMLTL